MHHLLTTLLLPFTNFRLRGGALRRLAKQTVVGPPPPNAADWANMPAVRQIVAPHIELVNRPNYFGANVWLTMITALLLSALAGLIFFGIIPLTTLGISPFWSYVIGVGIAALATISFANALTRNWGPELITSTSWAHSRERQRLSLDDTVTPPSVPVTLLLVAIVVADGGLAGSAIVSFFKAYFTPQVAMALAFVWGVVVAAVLWKLTDQAADEKRINQGREVARRMDTVSAADQADLANFLRLAGNRIGKDLGTARGVVKRTALFGAVLCLAVFSGAMRSNHPTVAPSAEPVPEFVAIAQDAAYRTAKLSADDEIVVPPLAPSANPEGGTSTRTPTQNSGSLAAYLPSIMLSLVLLISAVVLYWLKARGTFLNLIDSPRDNAVTHRFASADAVTHFNEAHLRKCIAALDRKLQVFAREILREVDKLAPSVQRTWPPVNLRAVDLLRKEVAEHRTNQVNFRLMGD